MANGHNIRIGRCNISDLFGTPGVPYQATPPKEDALAKQKELQLKQQKAQRAAATEQQTLGTNQLLTNFGVKF